MSWSPPIPKRMVRTWCFDYSIQMLQNIHGEEAPLLPYPLQGYHSEVWLCFIESPMRLGISLPSN